MAKHYSNRNPIPYPLFLTSQDMRIFQKVLEKGSDAFKQQEVNDTMMALCIGLLGSTRTEGLHPSQSPPPIMIEIKTVFSVMPWSM